MPCMISWNLWALKAKHVDKHNSSFLNWNATKPFLKNNIDSLIACCYRLIFTASRNSAKLWKCCGFCLFCHSSFLLPCLSLVIYVKYIYVWYMFSWHYFVMVLRCTVWYFRKAADKYFSKVHLWWHFALVLGYVAVLAQGVLGFADPSLEHHLAEQLQDLRSHVASHVTALLTRALK